MQLTPIVSPRIESGQDTFSFFHSALPAAGLSVQNGDIIAVASKVVALAQGRVVELTSIPPSVDAWAMAGPQATQDEAALAELIRQEADLVLGKVGPFYLTLKEGIFTANAGIDQSNTRPGTVVLWPRNPWAWAQRFRDQLMNEFHLHSVGVLVMDSTLTPLRRGVTGIALAYTGFNGIEREVGKLDLYGRPLAATFKSVADDLASAAVLMAGEAAEGRPFVHIRNAPAFFTGRAIDPEEASIPMAQDLFAPLYRGSNMR
jgi:coenzyme F420-0:L-glutamate ligase / coenzyme F420-1:gamma-L-glutamate ligase